MPMLSELDAADRPSAMTPDELTQWMHDLELTSYRLGKILGRNRVSVWRMRKGLMPVPRIVAIVLWLFVRLPAIHRRRFYLFLDELDSRLEGTRIDMSNWTKDETRPTL